MFGITEDKLERVLARRQFYARLRLPCAEVEVVLVLRNGFVEFPKVNSRRSADDGGRRFQNRPRRG